MIDVNIGRVISVSCSPITGKDAKWRTITVVTQEGTTYRLTIFAENRELVHTQLMMKDE